MHNAKCIMHNYGGPDGSNHAIIDVELHEMSLIFNFFELLNLWVAKVTFCIGKALEELYIELLAVELLKTEEKISRVIPSIR